MKSLVNMMCEHDVSGLNKWNGADGQLKTV